MARPRKFDESATLEVVRDAFWSRGYAGTRIDDLAAATGLGKGSLYGAFGDKHRLFIRVFDEHCRDLAAAVEERLAGEDDKAFQRLTEFLHAITDDVIADVEHRGCLVAKGAAELSGVDAEVIACTARTLDALHEALVGALAAAQRAGDIDERADPSALASLLLTVMRGIEALGKGGAPHSVITSAVDQAIALIPRT